MSVRRKLAEEGTHRARYEWQFLDELEDRQALRLSGWLYAGDGADVYDPEREITADMCLACGGGGAGDLHDPCIANLPQAFLLDPIGLATRIALSLAEEVEH